MMEDAADLAGFNVLQLVHENTAAAVIFGLDRKDFESSTTVLFVNMGGRDTEVSIVKYGSVVDEKEKQFEHIEILGEAWDSSLGSSQIDSIFLLEMVKRFDAMKERQGKPSILENARALRRLQKEVVRAKEVLSANKEADIKIPELLDYVTLHEKVSRAEFDRLMESEFARVLKPVTTVLEKAGLEAD